MPRPGFVLEVDEKTPPVLMVGGTKLRLERFRLGTLVAYPPDAEPSTDPSMLLTAALDAPVAGEPLADRLREARSVTIVIGDSRSPVPSMRYDVRKDVTEHVLELAARVGVDDVVVLAANGLHRRLTDADFGRLLGGRVVSSFAPDDHLLNHDVTDDANLAAIGTVDGHEVRVNRWLRESDLIVNVVVRSDDAGGPLQQIVCGLTDEATVDRVTGLDGLRHPERGAAVAQLIGEKLPILTIEVVLGRPLYERPMGFLGKREWEWNLADQLAWVGVRQVLTNAPKQASTRLFAGMRADYAVNDIIAGDPLVADEQGRQVWRASEGVTLPQDVDVLVTSVWGVGREAADPVGSPLAAAHHALVTQASGQGGVVREGGVLVAWHPLLNRFSNRHHTAAADFFADVLSVTHDADEIRTLFQDRYASDPWYLELYRAQHAYHPLHVFHQWYATQLAAARFSDVIWVGGDRRSAARLGHRAASTFPDALEIAATRVGSQPNVLVLR